MHRLRKFPEWISKKRTVQFDGNYYHTARRKVTSIHELPESARWELEYAWDRDVALNLSTIVQAAASHREQFTAANANSTR